MYVDIQQHATETLLKMAENDIKKYMLKNNITEEEFKKYSQVVIPEEGRWIFTFKNDIITSIKFPLQKMPNY